MRKYLKNMNDQLKSLLSGVYLLFLFVVVGCTNSDDLRKQVSDFMSHPIHIPYDQLEKRYCSMFSDSTESHKSIKMVHYLDSIHCTNCEINRMAKIDVRKRDLYPDVEFVFIIKTEPSEIDHIYKLLCQSRIISPVYLDTLNSFISANPHIPKSKKFHSFVMNDKDSVLMVGLPFSTNRMETLFMKIVDDNK